MLRAKEVSVMAEREMAVRKIQQYIAGHIGEENVFDNAAKSVAYAPAYARKLFIAVLGLSPAHYIRRLRLSRSALILRDGRGSVLDAALDMGYNSPEGYQRAFRAEFGCNPGEYARAPVPLWLFTPYPISTGGERKQMSETRTVFVQLIRKEARKVIVKRGIRAKEYFSYCEEVGCDVWGLLTSMKSLCGEPVCLFLPEKLRCPAENEYVQGVEAESGYDGPVPEGFDVISLPEAEYLIFRGEPFNDEDYEQAITEIWNAEKKYDPAFIGYMWDTENPRIQLEPRGERGYIELMPVRKK